MNKRIFGVEVPINELLPFTFTEEDVVLTQLDYMDAVGHAPFSGSVYSDLRKIDIRSTPASLDKWRTIENGTYRGTWGKRFSKYVKELYKYNLEAGPLSVMIETLAHATKDALTPFFIQFTNHADWKPGMYGDDGSCWWGAQQKSRLGLIEKGGGAILIHDKDQNPFGRLWYFPLQQGDFSVVFNIYDKKNSLTMLGVCRMLSMKFGVSYARVHQLFFPDSYLNGDGSAFMVGTNLVDRPISLMFAMSTKTTNVNGFLPEDVQEVVHHGDWHCDKCDRDFDDEDDGINIDDEWMCGACVDRLYSTCSDCNELGLLEDGIFYRDMFVCSDCTENYRLCNDCDKWETEDDSYWIECADYTVCNGCFDNHYFCCADCGNYDHDNNGVTTDTDETVCEKCAENNYYQCENCDNHSKDMTTVLVNNHEHEWCRECFEDDSVHECGGCNQWYHMDHECPNAEEE